MLIVLSFKALFFLLSVKNIDSVHWFSSYLPNIDSVSVVSTVSQIIRQNIDSVTV